MAELRHQGCGGGKITLHRALAKLPLTATDVAAALGLALLLTAGWLCLLAPVCSVWGQMFEVGRQALGLDGRVAMAPHHLGHHVRLEIPYLTATPGPPDGVTWSVTALATLLLLLVSFQLPQQRIPLIYLLRGIASVQGIALIYFVARPEGLSHYRPEAFAGTLTTSLVLLSLIPLLMSLSYYLFDFSMGKKLGLTLLMLLHLSFCVPLQYLVQTALLQRCSLLFLPLCHLLFGLPLDVLIFLAFYAWGMSWQERLPKERPSSDNRQSALPNREQRLPSMSAS